MRAEAYRSNLLVRAHSFQIAKTTAILFHSRCCHILENTSLLAPNIKDEVHLQKQTTKSADIFIENSFFAFDVIWFRR